MKRQFIFILLFYWVFHFLFPFVSYLFLGFVNLYSDVQGYDGFVINTLAVFGAILVISFLPSNDVKFEPRFNHANSFFLISVVVYLYKFFSGGGFEGSLTGATHGTFISFLSLFFNLNTAFVVMIFFQRNLRFIYLLILTYIVVLTAGGSRYAVVGLVIIALFLPIFENYNLIKNKFKRIIVVLSFISPFLFFYATSVRGDVDLTVFNQLVVGRISMVELSQIPITEQRKGTMNTKIYNEKYSAMNQFKMIVNTLSPIDPFVYDVSPNQYYRVVFLGASDTNMLDEYLSMNMTLPIYFVLMTNVFFGVIITIVFLVLLYLFWLRFSSNIYVLIMVIVSIYDILYYFDWNMVAQTAFPAFLTIMTLKYYNLFLNVLRDSFKTILKKQY